MIDFTKINAFPAALHLREIEIENVSLKSDNKFLKNALGAIVLVGITATIIALYKIQKNGTGKNE